ncbi:MAG: aldolase/citrate lyase family protein [Pseudomonadota bacterium]
MNQTEREMFAILKELNRDFGAIAVKAEFEAEGTRTEELLRLLDISKRANMKFGLKIGGCEAVRDLIEAKQFGVDYVIAPMVETSYALSKFIEAKNKVFSADEFQDVDFLVNIETRTSFSNIHEIAEVASTAGAIQGLVFGRVDYVGSKGMSRDSVDSDTVTMDCQAVAKICKAHHLDLVVGGGVSINAVPALRSIAATHLSRFETRKVIFDVKALSNERIQKGLLHAVHFELLWLLNKRDYYKNITQEDDKRIEMLDARWKILNR